MTGVKFRAFSIIGPLCKGSGAAEGNCFLGCLDGGCSTVGGGWGGSRSSVVDGWRDARSVLECDCSSFD